MPVAAPHWHKTSEDAARSAERKHGLAARPLRREGQCSTNAEVNTASWSIQVQENDVCLTGQTEGRGGAWRVDCTTVCDQNKSLQGTLHEEKGQEIN